MRLPPEPVLLAAKRWLEVIPSSGGIPRARALLTTHEQYSEITPTQYATALTWLKDLGLLEHQGSQVPAATRVLNTIFERAAPPWVQDADQLVRSPDELPSDIVSAGSALGFDVDEVFGHLVASWGKVDTAARRRVGAAGEDALVALLKECPGAHVDHVAAWSDGFGYDVAFAHGAVTVHLEVKSTTRSGRFTAYLSRHEYAVMARDSRWLLVTVRLTPEMEVTGIGHVPREWIAANTPSDAGPFGRWETVKLEVPAGVIVSGVPQLGDDAAARLPSW